ncbi:DNA-3-methyladenine glycosylase family protein [Saccharibacillus alkalitolerans]|uniref:DNA-3-methyladenine glycosylase II n=1 Tax=Saccharibacillus alkalitolerans TaxID=2705290 RepID=A0ABX0F6E0_9BACL|nr:DNA-3-methyladenine glycosylase [Saccharibacillus alkalitolerans]NGZ76523.1 DNA-3-methyladenine glycosylase 2 family protein [Saccharibacillus alkalitolerans]
MHAFSEFQAWQNDGSDILLPLPAEFSFEQNYDHLATATDESLYTLREGKIYKAIAVGLRDTVVEVAPHGNTHLRISFIEEPDADCPELRAGVARYVHDWFDLGTDLAPFYEMARRDPLLKGAVESFYGLRNMGIPDLYEAICWGILGQQINLAFAYTLKKRFVEAYGRSVERGGERYWLFPAAETIAALTPEELFAAGMTTVKKCEYLVDTARLVVNGGLTREALLETGDVRRAEKMLVKIRGIGPWTAHYVLMRCLRMPDAFPIDDVGLHHSIRHVLGLGAKPSRERILELSAGWTKWESYATFYLWRILY